ncbi:reverse transcriptase domain-containing protein [Tanacetum coccineum]
MSRPAGGNLLTKTPRDALTIIENKSKVRNSRNKPIVSKVSTNAPSYTPHSPEIAALVDAVKAMLHQKSSPLASVKAVEEICVTCGGPHPYYNVLAMDGKTFFRNIKIIFKGYVFSCHQLNYNQEIPGSVLKDVANQIRTPGFDPLALVEGFTPVEDNRGMLVALGMLPDDVTVYRIFTKGQKQCLTTKKDLHPHPTSEFGSKRTTCATSYMEDLVSKFINQFFPPSKTKNLRNEITNFQQRFDKSFCEAWDRFKDLLRACLHYDFTELHQLDTFYNDLTPTDQDSLNVAADGNLLTKTPRDALTIIENKSKVRNSRNKLIVSKVSTNAPSSSTPHSPEIAALLDAVKAMLHQKSSPLASVKAVEESCVTYGGTASYHQCLSHELVECLALADLGASINLMPLSIWKKLSLPELTPTQMILELADRSTTSPSGIAEDVFVKVGKTARALIDVYGEELTLRVDDEAITFKVGQTSRYSYNDVVSINRIDVIDVACEEYAQEVLGFSDSSTKLHIEELKIIKSSIDDPPELELKDLPSHLEYAFLEGIDKLPVIIAKNLKEDDKIPNTIQFWTTSVLLREEEDGATEISDPRDVPSFDPLALVEGFTPVEDNRGIGYSLKDKNKAKTDKSEHGNGKSVKNLVSKFINQFFPPSKTINLRNEITNFQQRFDESFCEAWDHFKDRLHACPHHGFTELHQLDTFYNALTPTDQDSLNATAGGNLLTKTPRDALTIIENKSIVRNSQNKPIVSKVSMNAPSSSTPHSPEIATLVDAVKAMLAQKSSPPASVKAQTQVAPSNELSNYKKINDVNMKAMQNQINNVKNELRNEMKTSIQTSMSNQTNELKNMMGSFFQMNTASSSGSGSLPSNTVANPRALIDEPVVAPKPKPSIPYPSRANKQKLHEKDDNLASKFVEIFRELHFELSFADALLHMPKFASMFKSLLNNKEKVFDLAKTLVNENWSAVILKKLPKKLGDPSKFLIPCDFRIGKFHFPADFVVVDYVVDPRVPLILRRPFLRTARALIDVYGEELTLRVDDEAITFKVGQSSRYSYNDVVSINRIDVIEVACEEYAQEVLRFSDRSMSGNPTPSLDPILSTSSPSLTPFEEGDFILEEIKACLTNDSIPSEIDNDDFNLEGDLLLLEKLQNDDPSSPLPLKELNFEELKTVKSSIDDPPELELKDLPSHLEYAFLEGTDKLPFIIAKNLKEDEKVRLLKVLKSYKHAIAWKISNIKGIDPQFCTHKILMEDDSKLVSLVHCVPKKGGITIIENEDNELIPTQLVMGWRVCIDYQKLNDATHKDNFPLPFIDQMLKRLAGNEYYCFLDGFSGYFQIPTDPQDQEKSTFTCPYGRLTDPMQAFRA